MLRASDQWSPIGGRMQVSRGVELVYGGGVGLMELVSRAVHRGGRRVIGYARLHDMYI
jgi:predicted Rossmann-fold nucleotide-binding protein